MNDNSWITTACGVGLGIAAFFRKKAEYHSDRPGPLLMVPLTGSEMAAQAGLSLEHERRLGMFPDNVREAIDRALAGEIDAETTAPAAPAGVGTIYFKPGEPKTFEEYGGQRHITEILRAHLDGLEADDPVVLGNHVFTGTAGGGKTLLAKVTTNEMRAVAVLRAAPLTELIECFTTDVPSVEALDKLMRRVVSHPGCVLFIDELQTCAGKEHWTKFLEVLENRRFQFDGDPYPTELPPFTVLAATTDFGTLSEPWRRRFRSHRFQRTSYEQLLEYVMHRHVRPIEDSAAKAIVDRTHWGGAPWECLQVYNDAVVFAKARRSPIVELADVTRCWDANQIDDMGLRPEDRDVMAALFKQPRTRRERLTGEQEFVCYAASEDNVVQLARVDRAEYKDYIRPKLMSRGLLEIRISYGQALTQLAMERYGHLRS